MAASMIRAAVITPGKIKKVLFLPTAKKTISITYSHSSCLAVNGPLVSISERIGEEGVSIELPSLDLLKCLYIYDHEPGLNSRLLAYVLGNISKTGSYEHDYSKLCVVATGQHLEGELHFF